jgi:hypothetical protein
MRIRFALIAEGGTEKPLVRVVDELCRRAGGTDVTGLWANEFLARHATGKGLATQIQKLLEHQTEINLLFVHKDADAADDAHVRRELEFKISSLACPRTVSIVPIQETEAWLLTDAEALRTVTGNPRGANSLELPKLKHIERLANPKEKLRDALIKAAKPGRQQQLIRSNDKTFGKLRRTLLEQLDIDGPVNQLSAWTKLVRDINEAVSALSHPSA